MDSSPYQDANEKVVDHVFLGIKREKEFILFKGTKHRKGVGVYACKKRFLHHPLLKKIFKKNLLQARRNRRRERSR